MPKITFSNNQEEAWTRCDYSKKTIRKIVK